MHELRRPARPCRRTPGRGPGGRGRRRGAAPASARTSSRLIPASSGVPGPGEITMRSGRSASASSTLERVVAHHLHLGAQLAQVLDEVEGERVVVVDEEDHARPPATRERLEQRLRPWPRSRAPRARGRSRPRCRRRPGAWPSRPSGRGCGSRCRSRGCRGGRRSRPRRRRGPRARGSSSSMICIARIFGRARRACPPGRWRPARRARPCPSPSSPTTELTMCITWL